ncbi:MAG: hypothetical protein R3D88_06785 [Alphaproteobacteria bacterium]|nr:hypothetical protein [Alphaproteobacteria bacterium]
MVDQRKEPHLCVVHGGGERKAGEAFNRPAGAMNLASVNDTPQSSTPFSTPEMRKIYNAYLDAQRAGQSIFYVVWNNRHPKAECYSTNNYESIFGIDDSASPYIFEDISKPFSYYISDSRLKEIQNHDDFERVIREQGEQRAFDNPYDELSELFPDPLPTFDPLTRLEEITGEKPSPQTLGGDWQASANPNSPYSEKIKQIHRIFDEQRCKALHNNLYIVLTDNNELQSHILPKTYDIADVNQFLDCLNTGHAIILSLDLSKNFDDQIRSGDFDPEQLLSFESLRKMPLDCLTQAAKTESVLRNSPSVLGPKRPTLAVDNPPKP